MEKILYLQMITWRVAEICKNFIVNSTGLMQIVLCNISLYAFQDAACFLTQRNSRKPSQSYSLLHISPLDSPRISYSDIGNNKNNLKSDESF